MSQPIIIEEENSASPKRTTEQVAYQLVRESNVREVGTPVQIVRQESGKEVIHAGSGPQIVRHGSSVQVVRSGSGAQVIRAGSGAQMVHATSGAQIIQGGAAIQRLPTQTSHVHHVQNPTPQTAAHFQSQGLVEVRDHPIPADLPIPAPQRRLEYIPYE